MRVGEEHSGYLMESQDRHKHTHKPVERVGQVCFLTHTHTHRLKSVCRVSGHCVGSAEIYSQTANRAFQGQTQGLKGHTHTYTISLHTENPITTLKCFYSICWIWILPSTDLQLLTFIFHTCSHIERYERGNGDSHTAAWAYCI